MPCANHADELLAAYPEAKVVLTTRDPDKWLSSMETSFYDILSSPLWSLAPYILPVHAPSSLNSGAIDDQGARQDSPQLIGHCSKLYSSRNMLLLGLANWTSGIPYSRTALRAGFIAHNEHIRNIVPRERLLEFTPKEGWEPLFSFLEKEVPNEPFPHVNAGSNTYRLFVAGFVIGLIKAYGSWLLGIGGIWTAYIWLH